MEMAATKTVNNREGLIVQDQCVLDFVVTQSMIPAKIVMMEILNLMMDVVALVLSKMDTLALFQQVSLIQYVHSVVQIEPMNLDQVSNAMMEMLIMEMAAAQHVKQKMALFVHIMCLEINPSAQ